MKLLITILLLGTFQWALAEPENELNNEAVIYIHGYNCTLKTDSESVLGDLVAQVFIGMGQNIFKPSDSPIRVVYWESEFAQAKLMADFEQKSDTELTGQLSLGGGLKTVAFQIKESPETSGEILVSGKADGTSPISFDGSCSQVKF